MHSEIFDAALVLLNTTNRDRFECLTAVDMAVSFGVCLNQSSNYL